MKRVYVLCAAVLLAAALCGCTTPSVVNEATPEPQATGRIDDGPEETPAATSLPAGETVPTRYVDLSDDVFVMAPDWSRTGWYGTSVFELALYSRTRLDVDGIRVDIDLPEGSSVKTDAYETHYDGVNYGVNQKGPEDDSIRYDEFTFDQYLCTLGFDWVGYGGLYRAERQFWKAGDLESQLRLGDEMAAMTSGLRENYYALTKDELPDFYYYSIRVEPRVRKDAVFSAVTVSVGGSAAEVPVGRVELKCQEPPWDDEVTALSGGVAATVYRSDSNYENGYYLFSIPCVLTAQTNVTVIRVYFTDDENELLGAHVVLTDPSGMVTDIDWDGSTPLELAAGATMQLEPGFFNERLLVNGASVHAEIILHWRADGRAGKLNALSIDVDWGRSPIEQWLEHTGGVDFETYYREYYRYSYDWDRGREEP